MASHNHDERTRRLCAVLGHELRNPLASAVTNVSIASAMMDGGDPRAEYLRQAQSDLERISSLLTAYLEFGRMGRTSRRRVDLVDVVRAVVSRKTGTTVRFEVNRSPIVGDADLLGRAVENMIENAFDAGASEVSVRLTESDGAAVLDISDDGPGVPNELHATVFEPFVS
ncbi:MAG: HAMP domain-containing histidine kinase, partial [Planctomycetes bacterium]|nr:HAMP domain-containing histidine kinase [Planctomycetota bacterium]